MSARKIRKYKIDDDEIEVEYVLDPENGRWYGNYPVFNETPRHTPNGRPWKNVFEQGCPHSTSEFGDCGGCSFFKREQDRDVIAVCFNENLRNI